MKKLKIKFKEVWQWVKEQAKKYWNYVCSFW